MESEYKGIYAYSYPSYDTACDHSLTIIHSFNLVDLLSIWPVLGSIHSIGISVFIYILRLRGIALPTIKDESFYHFQNNDFE